MLLERNLPDLCADRVDYTLRDMLASYDNREEVNNYLSSLTIYDNEIMFISKRKAKEFAEDYIMMDRTKWSHPREIALFQILADAVKIALKKGFLVFEDLFKTDAYVFAKLQSLPDKDIQAFLAKLNPKFEIMDSPEGYDFHVRNKLRYVNPKFITKSGKVCTIGEEYGSFNDELIKHKKNNKRGYYIKVISY